MAVLRLKRGAYESARIAVKRGSLYGSKKIKDLSSLSFDEILKFMEEHGFKESIDSSYLKFEGFYLIERILNSHLSKVYGNVIAGASKGTRSFLEVYYLKYQIHNIMAVMRCKLSEEEEVEPFLIGDERRKSKYLKAFGMPIEDSLVYMVKKIGFDSSDALEMYQKGMFELENYLYSQYYKELSSNKYVYNGVDEKKFISFIRTYVDFINARSFVKLKVEDVNLEFSEIFISGGTFQASFFDELKSLDVKEILDKLSHVLKGVNKDDISSLDKKLNEHKASGKEILRETRFGSPFYALKFLFEVESEISSLRTLLKAKHLNVSEQDITSML